MNAYFNSPHAWRSPASEAQLEAAAQALEMMWPEDLRALYLIHDGTAPERLAADWQDQWQVHLDQDEDAWPPGPYLMDLEEAVAWYIATQGVFPEDLRFFWTDDNSNYVGIYVQGPLLGMVCVFNHDGGTFVPAFRQLQDFLVWTGDHPLDDIFTDPIFSPAFPTAAPDPSHDGADWGRAQTLFAGVEDGEDSPRLACAMSLTPAGHSDVLLPYLNHADFYVVARAVEILTLRRSERAYEHIKALAGDGDYRSNGAAQSAMKVWRRP